MRKVVSVCMSVAVSAIFAADFVWDGDDTSSWKNPASYKDNSAEALPGPNDTVTLPSDKLATVRDAEVEFVSSIGDIVLTARNTLTFDVSGDYSVNCPIHQPTNDISSKTKQVVIAKKGAGCIELASTGRFITNDNHEQSYRASIRVKAGTLKLSQADGSDVSGHIFDIVSLEVAEGATFWTAYAGTTFFNGDAFSGGGVITNASPVARNLTGNHASGTFSGKIAGNIEFRPLYQENNWVNLTSDESTYTGGTIVYNGGRLGVGKFGSVGEPSSLGSGEQLEISRLGCTLLCLGAAVETTDKKILFDSSTPTVIDAGAFGGVTFAGAWSYKSSNRLSHILELTGSNTAECVLANSFVEPNYNGAYNYGTYIRKTGSGVWRLADNSLRANRGAFAVEEGTLRFDSVAPAGAVCSLGLSTVLKEPADDSAATAAVNVPYAVCVGGETTEGIFEYTGSSDVDCSTRPVAVKGTGRLRNATDCGFRWRNVFGWGTGANVLTLDGDSTTADNVLDTVTNANGTLSIVKDGDGTWTLEGDQTFNGTVSVRKGVLVVERPAIIPTWYRLTIKQNYHDWLLANAGFDQSNKSAGQSRIIFLQEFALYDADGVRRNTGLTYVKDSDASWLTPITDLQEGQIALDQGALANATRTPALICDNNPNGATSNDGMNATSKPREGELASSDYMNVGNAKTHIKVVMRLPAGTPRIRRIDWANNYSSQQTGFKQRAYQIYAFSLEGSSDGVTWVSLTNVVGAAESSSDKAWVSDGTTVSTSVVNRPGKGFPIDGRLREDVAVFDNVTSVSVAEGATLKADIKDGGAVTLRGLTVNPSDGVGTLDGFTFAASGTITLAATPAGNIATFRHAFLNATGVENLANWTLERADGVSSRIRMSVDAMTGAIRFTRPGVAISIK